MKVERGEDASVSCKKITRSPLSESSLLMSCPLQTTPAKKNNAIVTLSVYHDPHFHLVPSFLGLVLERCGSVNKGLNDVSQRLVFSPLCDHSKVVACISPWSRVREGNTR